MKKTPQTESGQVYRHNQARHTNVWQPPVMVRRAGGIVEQRNFVGVKRK